MYVSIVFALLTLSVQWGNQYLNVYPGVKQHYLHIIVHHTVEMWQQFGSLVRISNQASEACNYHHDKLLQWLGCHGGFGKTQAGELMEHRLLSLLYQISRYFFHPVS